MYFVLLNDDLKKAEKNEVLRNKIIKRTNLIIRYLQGKIRMMKTFKTKAMYLSNNEIIYISSISSSKNSGKSPTTTLAGFKKAPNFGGQVKYLLPSTLPSFLPVGSS